MKFLISSLVLHIILFLVWDFNFNPKKITFKIKLDDITAVQEHLNQISLKEKKPRVIRSQSIDTEVKEVQEYFNLLKEYVEPVWMGNITTFRELFKIENQLNVISVTIDKTGLIKKKEIITTADEIIADKILEKTFGSLNSLPAPPDDVIKDYSEIVIIWAFSYKLKIAKN